MIGKLFLMFEPFLKFMSTDVQHWFIKKMFCGERKRVFYKRFASMERKSTQVMIILNNFMERYKKKKTLPFEYYLVSSLIFDIKDGKDLVASLKEWLEPDEYLILSAGQRAKIADAIDRCVSFNERKERISAMVWGALPGPVLKVMVLFAFLFFIGKYTIPDLMQGRELKESSIWIDLLMGLSSYATSMAFPLSVAVIVFVVALLVYSFKNWTGDLRIKADKYLPWSAYRLLIGTNWLSSLSILIKEGMAGLKALEMTYAIAENTNPWLAKNIEKIKALYGTKTLGEAMSLAGTDFPDVELIEEVVFYSDQSGGDSVVMGIADEWGLNTEVMIKEKMDLISNILTGFISLSFGLVALSLIMFFQSMLNSVSGL